MRLSPIALIVLLTIVALVTAVPNDPEEITQAITDLSKTAEERNTKVLRNTNLINKISKKEIPTARQRRKLDNLPGKGLTLQSDRDKAQEELDNAALEHAKKYIKTDTNPPPGSDPEMIRGFHWGKMDSHFGEADKYRKEYDEQIKNTGIKTRKRDRLPATQAAAIAKAKMTVHQGHGNTHSELWVDAPPSSPPQRPGPRSFVNTNRRILSNLRLLEPKQPTSTANLLAAQVRTPQPCSPSRARGPKRLKLDVSGGTGSRGVQAETSLSEKQPPYRPTGVAAVIDQGPPSWRTASAGRGTGMAPSSQLPIRGTTVIGQGPASGGPVIVQSTDYGGTASGGTGGSSEPPMWWNPPSE